MSGDARISGEISIDPPLTWGELRDQLWALGTDGRYPDVVVKLDTTRESTAAGELLRHSGVAIAPTGHETNGYDLTDEVDRIARTFATAPDGSVRRFAGFLHVVWGGGEEIYRIVVRDGQAVEVRPTWVWPADASDAALVQNEPGA